MMSTVLLVACLAIQSPVDSEGASWPARYKAALEKLDTTITRIELFALVKRRAVGLIKGLRNKLLLKIAHLLKERHGMEMVMLNRKKSASDFVEDEAIRDFKTKADFVLAGVGD